MRYLMFAIKLIVAFIISAVVTWLLVYPVRRLAVRSQIIDIPNKRKIHQNPTPRMGGLAIVLGTFLGLLFLYPNQDFFFEFIIGAVIIVATGVLDDKYNIKPVFKLIGQLIPAIILLESGIIIDRINLPFFGVVDLTLQFSILLTLLWIIGVTNAINLIDGLDGLASGVSAIALISILILALADDRIFVIYLCIVLIGSNLGFLYHNFYPAKIYMGDTGSLFLGYCMAVISILGLFKKATLFSFIIPIIILAVPLFDTLFTVIRRVRNGEKIMSPDKKHFHHQLLAAGFGHRNTVLIIYGISTLFGILAIVFSNSSIHLLLGITFILSLLIYLMAEISGLVGKENRPFLRAFHKVFVRKKDVQSNDR